MITNIPKAIFYLLEGDYTLRMKLKMQQGMTESKHFESNTSSAFSLALLVADTFTGANGMR